MGTRTQFEELILEKAYHYKNSMQNSDVLDAIDRAGELPETLVKNVCAKVSTELSDELDSVCNLLSISKRRFIESSLIQALKDAKGLMHDEVDIFEHASDSADHDSTKQGDQ